MKKKVTKALIFIILDTKKIDDSENIHGVNPLYLLVNHANGYIEAKMDINTWFLMILLMKTKGY